MLYYLAQYIISVALTSLLAASAVLAMPAADEKQINEMYRRGLAGEKAAVVECIDKLEAVLKTDKGNQLARVYLGSAYTLRSRDLGFGPKKLETLNHGIALMDEAVSSAPDDVKVRLARALTTQSLPFFSRRAASSRKDFEMLAAVAQRSPASFDEGELQLVFYNAGLAAKTNGNREQAVALLQHAVRHPADAGLAKKVEEALVKQ